MLTVRFTIPIRFDDEPHPLDPTATIWDWFEVEAETEDDARLWINDQFGNDIWCSTYTDDAKWAQVLAFGNDIWCSTYTDDAKWAQVLAGRSDETPHCIAKLTVDTVVCPSCGHRVQPGTLCNTVADRTCLSPGCKSELPSDGGVHRLARQLGWARNYCGTWGTGFICPDHRTPNGGPRRES